MIRDSEKRREYHRKWMAQRRANWFLGKTCVDCGTSEKLQLDHIDRLQKIDHRIWSWSETRRCSELEKCVARCIACHIKKTRLDCDYKRLEHGSRYRGYRLGCRCDLCREAHAAYQRVYRSRKK